MPKADLYKIIRFTNKADFDFTSEMGAMYGGVPYFVPKGSSMLMPKPVAEHLATHLARQVFIKGAPIRDGNNTDGKGSDRPLWTEESIKAMLNSFLSDEYEERKPEPKSEAEVIAAKIAELNVLQAAMQTASAPVSEKTEPDAATTTAPVTATSYKDKAEVIAELKKRNIPFNARASKATLEGLLK